MFYVDEVFTSFHIILLWFKDETLVPNVFDRFWTLCIKELGSWLTQSRQVLIWTQTVLIRLIYCRQFFLYINIFKIFPFTQTQDETWPSSTTLSFPSQKLLKTSNKLTGAT